MPLPLANSPAHAAVSLRTRATRVVELQPAVHFWHLASLDAPTVAVTWTFAFAWAAHVELPAWVPVLIALGTLAVYIGDRLLDARASLQTGICDCLKERHHFHWRHRRILAPLSVVAALAAAAIVIVYMPSAFARRDSVLAAAAFAYFSGVHSQRRFPFILRPIFSKEFLVGVLFTAGCALPTVWRFHPADAAPRWPVLVSFAFFAALAWLNCHAIDSWESDQSPRVATRAIALGVSALLFGASAGPTNIRCAALAEAAALSALLIALLDILRARLSPLALRASADVVLLTPILLVPFELYTR